MSTFSIWNKVGLDLDLDLGSSNSSVDISPLLVFRIVHWQLGDPNFVIFLASDSLVPPESS